MSSIDVYFFYVCYFCALLYRDPTCIFVVLIFFAFVYQATTISIKMPTSNTIILERYLQPLEVAKEL